MRETTPLFQVNGQPLPVPDADVRLTWEDITSDDTARDESGILHRVVLRTAVPSWRFTYSHLTEQERAYLEDLFRGNGTFAFTHPSVEDLSTPTTTQCYRSSGSVGLRNAATGLWTGLTLTVTAC